MKANYTTALIILYLLFFSITAQAAITCTTPTSTGFTTAFNAVTGVNASVVPNVTQGTITTTCTRTLATDATTVYIRANNGANATGVQNRTRLGATRISYEAFKDSACSALWTSTVAGNYMPITLLPITTPQPISSNYWGCITIAGQVAAAGNYTDTVQIRVRTNNGSGAWLSTVGNFPVSIITPATCTVTTPPGNISFTYTAFGAAVNANTTFGATCTLNLPYTMSLDTYSSVLSGLNYSLNINSSTNANSRGTGAAQTHTINGSMPAGQAGTCVTGTCNASQIHTLTITY